MNMLKFVELIFLSNVILILLPLKASAKKLGSLLFLVVLTGCLLLVLRLKLGCVLLVDTIESNTLWGVFVSDRMALFFAFLTAFLVFICVSLLGAHTHNPLCYLFIFLSLAVFLVHTFFALNMLVFYALFEFTLIPMFLLILMWGSRQRKLHAMYMFFFYTVVGSIFLLTGLLFFYLSTGSLILTSVNFIVLKKNFVVFAIWVCFFIGFAFKVPIVPFHTWLPEAHVEAPTVGSMILAGLLLKVGTFGMLRFMFPGLNIINSSLAAVVFTFAVFSIFYASLLALRQIDMKKIIAYSSVAHMGFVVAGLFSLSFAGLIGSYFTMVSHGVVASALFFLVGVLYERYHSRNLLYYGGFASLMPLYAFFFFLFTLANIGFPFTSNFVGEFLILVGIVSVNLFTGVICLFSIVLAPLYSLWMYNRVFYGQVSSFVCGFGDLNVLELYICCVFCFLMLLGGVAPEIVTHYVENEYYKIII